MNKLPYHQLVYVAGPYRAYEGHPVEENIQKAREAAIRLWQAGNAVICPHANSAGMDGIIPDDEFIRRDLLIVARCDSIYLLKDFRKSRGALEEQAVAVKFGLEIYYEEEETLEPSGTNRTDE